MCGFLLSDVFSFDADHVFSDGECFLDAAVELANYAWEVTDGGVDADYEDAFALFAFDDVGAFGLDDVGDLEELDLCSAVGF